MRELGPILETERLILRPPREEDLDGWAGFMADAEAQRFLGGPQPRPAAWRHLATHAGSWALKGYGMFSVLLKAEGRWIGRVGPQFPEGWPGPEVGWSLVRDVWGQGYALEAATASMDWAIQTLGWGEVVHCIDAGNTGSIALALRLGSQRMREAAMPAPFEGHVVELYGQTAAAWRARRDALARGSASA